MITEDAVRRLATRTGDPVVASVYLDVDGRHRPVPADYEAAFESLADDLRRQARARGDGRLAGAVEGDVEQMRAWLRSGLDRRETRGVGLFSNCEQGFFEAVALPRPVDDEAALGPTPRVTPLLALLDEHRRFLVALVDREHLRLLRFELGEVEELPVLANPIPRGIDTEPEVGGFQRYAEEARRAHVRRSAEHVRAALGARPVAWLVLGGPSEAVAALEQQLPQAVADKVAGRLSVSVGAPTREVADAALELEESIERRREADAIEELRQRVASGRGGVVGLEATLDALAARRVAVLFVSHGFRAPGARCPACDHVGVAVRQCPQCGTTNEVIDDVVELAVDNAVAQGARVQVCRSDDMERLARIGAIERF